jgi:hypothetical protein
MVTIEQSLWAEGGGMALSLSISLSHGLVLLCGSGRVGLRRHKGERDSATVEVAQHLTMETPRALDLLLAHMAEMGRRT